MGGDPSTCNLVLLSQAHWQVAGWEMEQLGFELLLKRDAGVTDKGFMCHTTAPASNIKYCKTKFILASGLI